MLTPLADKQDAAGFRTRIVLAPGFVADEVAGPENGAVIVNQIALENEEFLDAPMDMKDGFAVRIHPHEIAAVSGGFASRLGIAGRNAP